MNQSKLQCFPVQEVQLVYKQKYKPSERPQISTSTECYQVILSTWNIGLLGFLEQFKILLLNRANRVIGCCEISTGGMCSTVVDPKIIFATAIKACASSIILVHNHPSGNLTPSTSDIELTKKLIAGGKLLDVMVVDHIIITCEGYLSFADEGLI